VAESNVKYRKLKQNIYYKILHAYLMSNIFCFSSFKIMLDDSKTISSSVCWSTNVKPKSQPKKKKLIQL